MTGSVVSLMETQPCGIGPRTAAFLREIYPKDRAKLIARDFRVSVGTAERWLRGEAPTTAHVEQMVARFGAPYLRRLFVEAFDEGDSRLEQLMVSVSQGLVAASLAGVMTGVAHARDLLYRGGNAIGEAAGWALRAIGLENSAPLLEAPNDPERILLIEALIETVPLALPAPEAG